MGTAAKAKSKTGGIDKPKVKQSKSRNGCVTCKAKRLKCDEIKPGCMQCQKRNVECGGYNRDFKWRLFGQPASPKQKMQASSPSVFSTSVSTPNLSPSPGPRQITGVMSPWFGVHTTYDQLDFSEYTKLSPSTPMSDTHDITAVFVTTPSSVESVSQLTPKPESKVSARPANEVLPASQPLEPVSEDVSALVVSGPSIWEGHSQRFSKVDDDDEIELRGPADPLDPQRAMFTSLPSLDAHTRTALMFHTSTCSVMSIIDTSSENPWRSLFWPLAQTHRALYHGVAAMANFHAAANHAEFRVEAVEHMRIAIHELILGLNNNMPSDVALATTITLAFAEAWDRHISLGTAHLRGARTLIRQFVSSRYVQSSAAQRTIAEQERLTRFTTLYNAWKYVSVIARLTSDDDTDGTVDEMNEEQAVFAPNSYEEDADPLMGFAQSLFPLIGKVASLVRHVRLSGRDDMFVSSALELKSELESWQPSPRAPYIVSEDPCFDSVSAIATAHAYQYAALLYLFQCVPSLAAHCDLTEEPWYDESIEIDSLNWSDKQDSVTKILAAKVLNLLSTIPTTSRTCVVHIFPLLSAACGVDSEPMRDIARARWFALARMLKMGNVDRALDVVEEVWRRKKVYNGGYHCKVGFTHWTTVMREWGWEILLG